MRTSFSRSASAMPASVRRGGLFRARWSPTIIDEWRRNLIAKKPQLAASIDAQFAAMNRAFPEACVEGGEALIDSLSLPDPGDRHVLATAIRTGAEQIVTENLRDFPDSACAVRFERCVSRRLPLQHLRALSCRSARDAQDHAPKIRQSQLHARRVHLRSSSQGAAQARLDAQREHRHSLSPWRFAGAIMLRRAGIPLRDEAIPPSRRVRISVPTWLELAPASS